MRQKFTTKYGEVEVKSCIIDLDGTNMEEGITINSCDDTFDSFELVCQLDIENLIPIDVELLIDNNI